MYQGEKSQSIITDRMYNKEDLPSINDYLEDSNLPSYKDFIEERQQLPSVKDYTSESNQNIIEEETQTIEDENGESFLEVVQSQEWSELIRLVNDVRKDIPKIPEIRYYDEQLEEICDKISQIQQDYAKSEKINVLSIQNEEFEGKLYDIKEEINNLPEVKYYEEDLKTLKLRIEQVKEEIPTFPDWIQEVHEVPDFSWIGKSFSIIDDDFSKVQGRINLMKEKIDYTVNQINEDYDIRKFEFKVDVKNLSENLDQTNDKITETKDKIYKEIKETSVKIWELRNTFKDDDKKLKKSILGEQNKLKQSLEDQVKKIDEQSVRADESILKFFSELKETVDTLPKVKYYDKDISSIKGDISSLKSGLKELNKISSSIKKSQETLKENYLLNEPPSVKEKAGGQTDPLTPLDQKFATLDDLSNHYRLFINRVTTQLSTIGGGGETRLQYLDDVDRDTALVDGKFLKYESASGKFVGSDGGGGSGETSKIILDVRNNNVGYALTIGTPVYQVEYNSGQDRLNVEISNADTSSTMPAKGIVSTTIENNTNGQIIVYGELEGVNTSAFDVADELYVAPGGGLTNVRPTDPTHLVQKIAVVLKKSAGNGAILVYGAGRTNDVPNNISIAGSITAVDGFFSGNVSVGGTLTYEDVTNIDSVGLITARTGIKVLAGGIDAVGVVTATSFVKTSGTSSQFLKADGSVDSSTYITSADGGNADQLDGEEGTYYLDYNNFSNTPTIPTNNNQLTNGAGFITTSFTNTNQLTNGAGFITGVSTFSGDYNNLTNTPTIPTNNNQLTNGAGYITTSFTNTNQLTNGAGFVTFTNNNQLTNGAGYITTSFTNTNQLTNGAGFVTFTNNNQLTNGAGYITTSFTDTNQLTNGAGFITNNVTGVITATTFDGSFSGNVTGIASTATKLETSRNFSISGDFITASSVSFDGTGDVSLAATITTDSIALGTYTTGDYVESITGTGNQITVTSGTGEGSTPVISIPDNPTLPGTTVTVATDLQVNRNLNVTGNITIGGTSATIFAETLKIADADIILGFRTDANGNDVSNDTTASHGGIAIASTEGTPLVSLIGAGETLPATYKKIMWFQSGAFTGLATDAWLSNYAFGVGTTSMSAGTKFAVGNIETDFDDITSVRHINSSGVITATTFSGNLPTTDLTGTITNAQLDGSIANDKLTNSSIAIGGVTLNLGDTDATPAFDLSDATAYPYTSLTGITTEIVGDTTPQLGGNLDFNSKFITGTGGINVTGVITATTFSGSLPTTDLTGTITNAQLAGSIANDKLVNDSVSFGGVSVDLGASDATPAFDLSAATNYPYTSLTGITTEIVGDTSPQLGGNLDVNNNNITGTGNINITGIITATTFSGNLPTTDLTGTITNAQLDGSIANDKLANSTMSVGGVTLTLGATDATPAFDLSDATSYPYTSLTGITTEIVGDTTPQLGGNLDLNGNDITGTGNVNITGIVTATNIVSIKSDDGTSGRLDLYCESNNAHYARLQAPDHGDFSGNPIIKLPATAGTLLLSDGSGASLTSLDASNLGSGTVPDARFPATLPASSGASLTGLTGASAATYGDASNVAQIVVDANGRITGISNVAISGGGGDTVSITTTAADILSVSSGAISADDAGADKIVFWDDSEGKLTYLTVGTNLTVTDTTISASGGGGSASDSFKTISVSGQSDVVADSPTDTLTLIAGSNMTITTDASGDSITLASSGGGGSSGPDPVIMGMIF